MKRIISVMLSLVMLFSLTAGLDFSAYAATDLASSGSCGDNVTWSYDSTTGVLTISGTGDMTDYTSGQSPFNAQTGVKSLIISDGVTSVGSCAFASCINVTSVIIPDSVTNINYGAFYNCKSIKELTIPCSAKIYNSSDTFYNCKKIEKMTLSKGTGIMIDYVNSLSSSVTTTCYQYTPWHISRDCFKELIISDGITHIGSLAFDGCYGLTAITIPDSVTSIGDDAFSGCYGLTAITIPDSVTSIGDNAFSGCNDLTGVYITDFAKWCQIDFGYDSNPLTYAKKLYLNGSLIDLTNVTIPNGVTKIGSMVFKADTDLTSITIPDSVSSIGCQAFDGCTGLTDLTIPDTVTSIGEAAFQNCSGLTSITIPSNLTYINDYVFRDCTGLTNLIIPNNVTIIGAESFMECTGLKSITIPDSVTSIGYAAFLRCTSIEELTIPGSVTTIGGSAFAGCTSLRSVKISNGVPAIGGYMFSGCTALTSVIIPDSVTTIGGGAFYECTGLTSIAFPDSVTSIGEGAFEDCSNLTNVFYLGSDEQWGKINIETNNDCLTSANIHYNATDHTAAEAVQEDYVAPTCTENGHYYLVCYCSGCGLEMSRKEVIVPATRPEIGHSYNATVTAPTCTEQGYTTYTCSFCGYTYVSEYTNATGHKYIPTVTPPTCTEQGYTTHICSVCKDTYVSDYTDAAGHKAAEPVEENVVPPTCADNGQYDSVTYCSVCKTVLKRETLPIPATGQHTYVSTVIEPTPIEQGYTLYTCSVCGDSYKENYTDFEYGAPSDYGKCSDSMVNPVNWYYFETYNLLYIDGSGVMKNYSSSTAVPWYSYSDNIKNAIVTANVKGIGTHAFASLGNIETFTAKSSEYFLYSDGAIYSSDKTVLKAVLPFRNKYTFTVPGTVETVNAYAFENCDSLNSVTIPDTVNEIGASALYGCSSLSELVIPFTGASASSDNAEFGRIFGTKAFTGSVETEQNSVKYQIPEYLSTVTVTQPNISNHAFENCTNLTNINFSSSVNSIGEYAFYNCQGLKAISIPANISEIGKYAFYGCSNVTSLVLPKGVYTAYDFAFSNMTGLTQITVPDDFNYSNRAFEGTCNIKTATITYSSGTLSAKWGIGLFNEHTPWYVSRNNCTTINLPDKLERIDKYIFYNCVKIKSINIPSSLRSIGEYAFYRCEALSNLNLTSVETIEDYAFYRCYSINKLIIPNSVKSIGENCFEGCTGITRLDIGTGLTKIPENAFSGCTGISNLVIGNNIKSVSSKAFENCTGITEYTAPVHLSYKEGAFNGVTNIKTVNLSVGDGVMPDFTEAVETPWRQSAGTCTTVNIANGVNNIGDYAFTNMLYLSSVTIPESVTYIGIKAFDGCSRLSSITLLNMGVNVYDGAIPYFVSIYTYNNSKGELYAKRNGNIFVSLGDYVCKTHNYSVSCEAATLTNNGLEVSICSVCGKMVKKTIYHPKSFKLSSSSYVYDGKVKTPSVIVKDTQGNIIPPSNYTLSYSSGRKAIGSYSVKLVFKGNYSGTKALTFKITKAANTLKAKAKKPTVSFSKVKINDRTISRKNAIYVSKAQGKVTYKKASGNKNITVASNGNITVKKGLKKGTYKVKVKVKAAGNATYKAKTVTVTVTIRIK